MARNSRQNEAESQEIIVQEIVETSQVVEVADNQGENAICEQAQNAVEIIEPVINAENTENSQTACDNDDGYTDEDFNKLSMLVNKPVRDIKEEIFLNQIYALMSKVAKVVVRYNVLEVELEQLFRNAKTLQTDGVVVSPTYLSVCKRIRKKNKLEDVKLSSIIDFPFGESTFKTKAAAIREGKGYGVIESTVMMPSMLLTEQNIKQFKCQCTKLGWKKAGIALNATDIDEETLKRAVKASNKSKISHIAYVFGEEPIDVVMQKVEMISKNNGTKKIFVLANVDRAETVGELIKLGVDKVLTPYADEIGKELLERFKIKSIKTI